MITNKAGIELIKAFEGLRLVAYADAVGVATIGYGHTRTVKKSDIGKTKISAVDAENLLKGDLAHFENAVSKLVKVPLTSNQFSALVSFAYNLGEGNLSKSTLLKKLNAKDYRGAAVEFEKWNKAGGKVLAGLVRRRAAERRLFETA